MIPVEGKQREIIEDLVRSRVDQLINKEVDKVALELESLGYEGDTYMAALSVIASTGITIANHIETCIHNLGGMTFQESKSKNERD